MKKLMIAAAVAIAGIAANAATVDWKVSSVYAPGTATRAGNTMSAYLLVESASISGGTFSTFFAREDAITSIGDGDLSFLSYAAVGDKGTAAVAFSSGTAKDTGAGNFAAGSASDNIIKGYVVILSSDQTLAWVTDLAEDPINAMESQEGFSWTIGTSSQDASNWMTVGSVPEPTSGLLLLLGVAGLALRRRRV